ncbi:helix-turn-helix transcriptional regulator [Streptomyces sp. NPDC052676]|uniref:helix-turn-helix domain-containing protein n=1 Tax=Streptomyces sp. NPDC052676 TaxID=3154953 RepID=UPI0034423709
MGRHLCPDGLRERVADRASPAVGVGLEGSSPWPNVSSTARVSYARTGARGGCPSPRYGGCAAGAAARGGSRGRGRCSGVRFGTEGRGRVKAVRDGRSGRASRTKEEAPDLPGVWSAYGVLLQHLRKLAGLSYQQLGDAIGYSLERIASVEHGRRPAKAAFTVAADRMPGGGRGAAGAPGRGGPGQMPRFFHNFSMIEGRWVRCATLTCRSCLPSRGPLRPERTFVLLDTKEH